VKREKEISDAAGKSLKYLDLGCGNGSVLQMVSWGLIDQYDLQAFGIEARQEAVLLARRSLSFNIGKDNVGSKISVIHGDFRDLEDEFSFEFGGTKKNDVKILKDFNHAKKQKFDLVTGTPPYFQVDFRTEYVSSSMSSDTDRQKVVTSAVINQGGMPTSIQSAPGKSHYVKFRNESNEFIFFTFFISTFS
jgi:tRNA1(Val) A37 N6-methylase TrmN6